MKANRFGLAALVLAVTGALFASFGRISRTCGAGLVPDDATRPVDIVCRDVSNFSMDGAWILVIVSVPVLVALMPSLVRSRKARTVSAGLLWTCCVVGAFSVGMFFIPAAVVMTVAAASTRIGPGRDVAAGGVPPSGRDRLSRHHAPPFPATVVPQENGEEDAG